MGSFQNTSLKKLAVEVKKKTEFLMSDNEYSLQITKLALRNGEKDEKKRAFFLVEVLSFDPQISHAKDLWFSSHH